MVRDCRHPLPLQGLAIRRLGPGLLIRAAQAAHGRLTDLSLELCFDLAKGHDAVRQPLRFAHHMVADHRKDIAAYQKESKKTDAVGQYAKDTLPTLQKHLDAAQALEKNKSAGR